MEAWALESRMSIGGSKSLADPKRHLFLPRIVKCQYRISLRLLMEVLCKIKNKPLKCDHLNKKFLDFVNYRHWEINFIRPWRQLFKTRI
jgi:hypothetical protein